MKNINDEKKAISRNDDLLDRVTLLNCIDDSLVLWTENLAKDGVLAVEMRGWNVRDEKLRAVRVRA